jgi:hypothetical protein
MLLEGVPRAAIRVVRSAGYWVGSVVGGGGGAFSGSWAITRRFLASLFLAFGVFECRTIFFVIFCTFSQNSIALGGVVVVLWSSGGGCYARSRACTKATPCTKAPPCTLIGNGGRRILAAEGMSSRKLLERGFPDFQPLEIFQRATFLCNAILRAR